ncbi:YfaP family protein [Caldimonas brevitalea]|uniref:DUF2135 domain-containing protein n=1 Tax=Caldimonas brevitalea TaxID=413882 RepID=A0A0G3BKK2_9BURK|nr:DUF2135 domain-containing protein [Caldimonas brevitalea]AKJ29912.1 hypothetical protein AAW51_3221 [Caldimonas brevitalea]
MKYMFIPAMALAMALGPAAAPAQQSVTLELPRGGWRTGGDPSAAFLQEVHYPASRVATRADTSALAQIKGHIDGHAKAAPATLVVNGVAMPLETDEAGGFQRPYAFSGGSNSVEVRGPHGVKRTQFIDAGTGARPRLRVLLSWDTPGTDVDLHVITPRGAHAYYAQRVIDGGGALDVDVTTGYGPEIFAATRPERGTWHVYVNYYGGGEGGRSTTMAQVAVISGEGTASETQRVFRVPLRSTGDLQHVASFSVL